MTQSDDSHSAGPDSCEAGERAILGGLTVEECLRREGGGFWLRLSQSQTEALKIHLRKCAQENE